MSQTQDRWGALQLALQQTVYRNMRGSGVGVIHVSLMVVDGELICWSNPEATSYGPYNGLQEFVNKLGEIESAKVIVS